MTRYWHGMNSLNPFEVREVLQVRTSHSWLPFRGLNPFEVREVLQDGTSTHKMRCFSLNPFEVREVLQVQWWAWPCAGIVSQSLWSQGGAARVLYKTFLLKSISYLLFFVKNFLTKSYFPKFCKERILVTEVLWHKFAFWSGFFERCVTFI